MFDLLKKSISSSPLGQAFTTAKNFVTGTTSPKPTVPTIKPTVEGPVGYTPYTKPTPTVQTPQPVVQPYTQPQITQARVDSKFTDNVKVEPKSTVKADTLSPDNTMSSLRQARKEMETRFLEGLKPSDNLTKLAELQNERADLEEQYEKEYKELKANPEGKLSGNLNAQLREVKERQNDQLAKMAVREGIALGIVNREEGLQDKLLKSISEITKLTQDDIVGSLQTNPITGEIYAMFRNPETGEMRQETVGQTSIKPDYDIRTIDGRVVALDQNLNVVKDLGASGSGSTGVTQMLSQMPDFNSFVAEREKQLGMSLGPQAREQLQKEYTDTYTSVINQTLANKFSKSEIGKLSAAGLIGSDLNTQINFLYGKDGGDDELMSLLENWGSSE
jgi:hypothetical protein